MKANAVNYNCNGTHILRAYLSGRLYNCLNFLNFTSKSHDSALVKIVSSSLQIVILEKVFLCSVLYVFVLICFVFSQHIFSTLSSLRNLRLDLHLEGKCEICYRNPHILESTECNVM